MNIRLHIILLAGFASFFLLTSSINGQNEKIVDSKGSIVPPELLSEITVKFQNTPFVEAIHEISQKGRFHLNYNENVIPKEKKITLTAEKQPAFVLLQKIIKGLGLDIIIINPGQIVITKSVSSQTLNQQSRFTISGYVTDTSNGEALIEANIYIKEINSGTTTNKYGFYSITLPADVYLLLYSYVGFQTEEIFFDLNKEITKNVELKSSAVASDTIVVISRAKNENIISTKIGTMNLLSERINNIPVLLGEQDILKTIQLLPGISNYREGDCGIFVRGGESDQNLILLDEAPVYNAFHTFGIFSIFNADAINSINIIKGTAPAKYGGRLSSVVDMQMNEGNMKDFSGIAGIGLIFSRLTLQGPLKKDKASYLISGRRTYFDLFTKLAPGIGDARFYFYDLNAKVNYKIDEDDRIYVSGYFGRDGIGFSDVFDMDWGNSTATIRWNHLFGNKVFLNSSFIFSNYKYEANVFDDNNSSDQFNALSEVNSITLKEDFEYFHNAKNTISFGIDYIHHSFLPAKMSLSGDNSYRFTIGKRAANEWNAYLSHEYSYSDNLKFEYGIRSGIFSVSGDKDIYNLGDIANLDVDFHNKENTSYFGLEPRFTATYVLDESSSLKFGLSRNYQNIHQLSNTNSGTPLDIWQSSSSRVKPERSDQVSLGYFKNLDEDKYEFSSEIYYKDLRNQIDYKDGANYILKNFFESELVFGRGWAYGLELLLRKNTGDLTGWVSYTISNSRRQFDKINNGRSFPAKNNKTHEFSLVAQYKLSPKWVVSANWIFTSGFNITVPYGSYYLNGERYLAYTDRNGYRLPPYHRLDLGISYTNDLGGTWNFSIYNAYGRKNIYTIIFRDRSGSPGKLSAVKLTLFSIIPSLSYTLRF